ncbi:glycoside hydrolase, partial [bacterium]|nr:glycoside hydrolase [bacterium]
MATTTRPQHPALVVMDPRLDAATDLWDAHSTVTAEGERAGLPVPGGSYSGSLRAAGVPTEPILIQVQDAGVPSGEQGAATFVTRSTTATDWSGWEGPGAVSHWEALTYSSNSANWRTQPHVAVSPAGSLIAAARVGSGSGITIETYTRAAGSTTWGSAVTVGTRGQTPYAPCVLAVGKRLMLFAAVEDTVSGLAYPWAFSSDDDGATWVIAASPAARDLVTVQGVTGASIQRIRAAYANGQIILFLHTLSGTTNTTYQYASSDLGASFQRIATLAGEGFGDVIAADGQFVHISAVFSGGVTTRTRRYGSAYQGPQSAVVTSAIDSATALGSGYLTNAGVATVSRHNGFALVRDDTGVLYAICAQYTADPDSPTHRGQVAFSEDNGLTWAPWGIDVYSSSDNDYAYSARWWGPNTGDPGVTPEAVTPTALSAVYWRGRVVVAHNWRAPTSTFGSSLGLAYLGGMTQLVTLPPV